MSDNSQILISCLWRVQSFLQKIMDEYQPNEPLWSETRALHSDVVQTVSRAEGPPTSPESAKSVRIVWTCGIIPGHTHSTRQEAEECILREAVRQVKERPPL